MSKVTVEQLDEWSELSLDASGVHIVDGQVDTQKTLDLVSEILKAFPVLIDAHRELLGATSK